MQNDIVTYLKKRASFLLSYSIVISKKLKKKFKHSPRAPGQYRKAGGMGVLMGRGKTGLQRTAAPGRGERGDMACSDLTPVPLTPWNKQDITGMLTSSEEGSILVHFCGKRELTETQGVAHISCPADAATPPQISVLAA